jgi:Flp pilus assembly protein TadG
MHLRRHDAASLGSPAPRRYRQRGATIVEFAITAGFSIGLLFLIIEFGIAMFNQGVLMHAARVGARVASLYWEDPSSTINPKPQALSPPEARIRAAASGWANMAVRLTPVAPVITICWYSKDAVLPSLTDLANNTVCQANKLPGSGATVKAGDMVLVRTSLNYSGPISLALTNFGLNLNLGSAAVMRVE